MHFVLLIYVDGVCLAPWERSRQRLHDAVRRFLEDEPSGHHNESYVRYRRETSPAGQRCENL